MHTVQSRFQRPTIIGAVLALLFGLGFFAAPAQAATLSFSSDASTVELGQSFTLSWSAGETTGVEASGSWSGSRPETGTEEITPSGTGSFTYTLTARDFNGRDVEQSVTVEVTEAALPEVTPAAVTFPGDCSVVVPETEGVIYSVTLDGYTEVIDAGTYDGSDFFGDSAAVFTAAADDEHVLADGAVTSWSYTPGEECFDGGGSDEIVTTTSSCSAVTFTNITDVEAGVQYGSFDESDADGDFVLAAGASKKIKTSRSTLDFIAFGEDEAFQVGSTSVPQKCGEQVDDAKPSVAWKGKHPTAAPAAGVVGADSGPAIPLLVLLGTATLVVARRAYPLGR